jgi:DNA-binding CsgD family transcriptional regulator/predicted negative regulator of RcsB-dependent stress response
MVEDGSDRLESPEKNPTPALFERDQELAALQQALAAAERGAGSRVLIEGPAGIGKSRLLAAAADLGRTRGFTVLAGRGIELERDTPFAVAADLFVSALSVPDHERAELLAGQAGLAAQVVEPVASEPGDAQAAVRGLYWLTVNLTNAGERRGRRRPLVVLVDDAQWVDRPSMAFLAYLAARVEELPVALVVAVRTGDAPVTGHMLDAFSAPGPRTLVLRPGALSDRAVREIVARELPGAEPAFSDACAHVTGGNPFLVCELARALRADGVVPTATSVAHVERLVPDSVLHSVLVRVARLGDAAQRVAEAVAVLGDGAPLRHAAAIAALDAPKAEEAADLLARSQILDPGEPLRFTHPLIATAISSDRSAFARARAHRQAADLLAADGAPLERIAAHLLLTRPDGDDATVRTLRGAAVHALAQGDPAAATRLLERATTEPPRAGERARVLLELGEAQLAQGVTAAEQTIDEALDLLDQRSDRARALIALGRFRFNHGEHTAAADAYHRALAEIDPNDPAAEQLLAEYLIAHTFEAQLHPVAQGHLAPIIDAADRGHLPENPGLVAHLTLRAALAGRPREHVRAFAERATARDPLVDPGTHGFLMGMVVQALVFVDELHLAERISNDALAAARRRGSLLAYTIASYHRALPRYHAGALAEGLGDIEQALIATQEGWSGGAWVFTQKAHMHLERGELAAARESVALARTRSPDSMDHAIVMFAGARVALANREPAAALEAARAAGDYLARNFGIDHPGFVPWREVAAVAAHSLGDADGAARLSEESLELARSLGVPRAISSALRTNAALVDNGSRVRYLEEAVSVVDGHPSALERAHGLVGLGAALRSTGQRDAARSRLREGLQLADAIGATPLADRARAELRATGARPRRAAHTGADALTPTERRVSELAAAGLTNPEIAQDLFVTIKTIETHLAHAYRKLGIDSRRELLSALGVPREVPTRDQ